MKIDQQKVMMEALLTNSTSPITFPKHAIPVHESQSIHHLYFIIKGLVRGYYLDESGKEITKCFSAENEFFGTEGFLYGSETTFSIECLEEVVCYRISYEQIRTWMTQESSIAVLVNTMVIEQLRIMEERAKSLLLSDAKQRYEKFLNDYSQIAGRLTQKMIASYLGINEASLSRIKKKY